MLSRYIPGGRIFPTGAKNLCLWHDMLGGTGVGPAWICRGLRVCLTFASTGLPCVLRAVAGLYGSDDTHHDSDGFLPSAPG